jgi:hypothetical protein
MCCGSCEWLAFRCVIAVSWDEVDEDIWWAQRMVRSLGVDFALGRETLMGAKASSADVLYQRCDILVIAFEG